MHRPPCTTTNTRSLTHLAHLPTCHLLPPTHPHTQTLEAAYAEVTEEVVRSTQGQLASHRQRVQTARGEVERATVAASTARQYLAEVS